MSSIERKNLGSPDETEHFPRGVSHEVHLGELTVARNIHQPGWHWAEHVRPIVGGSSCRIHHTGYVVRGRSHVRHDDGTEMDFGPDDVIDVASAMVRGIEEIDLRIRAGVHTGEVEYVPGNVRGVAVHVASRIMALAGPGEVLVSDTTRGLIESRELTLVDRGRHALKGVSERRKIFAVG